MVEPKDLRKISIFRDCTDEELDNIKNFIFEKNMRQGMALFYEGMSGGVMYLVKSGEIEIFKRNRPEDIIYAKLGPGDFVGEMSLFDDEPRSASARITQTAVLMVITKASFQDMIKKIPEGGNKILLTLLKMISKRLRVTNQKLAGKQE